MTNNYNLSPKQATALNDLANAPWTILQGQAILQTTLGALYKRKLIRISGRHFHITPLGRKALQEQSEAQIERKRREDGPTSYGPFAQVIAELAEYTAPKEARGVVHVMRANVA